MQSLIAMDHRNTIIHILYLNIEMQKLTNCQGHKDEKVIVSRLEIKPLNIKSLCYLFYYFLECLYGNFQNILI